MAEFDKRACRDSALSSTLPHSNPKHLKLMTEAQRRAAATGTCQMVSGEHGIYIGVPQQQQAKDRDGR